MSKTILFMRRHSEATCDGAKWEESKHKRDKGGRFSSTGGGGGKSSQTKGGVKKDGGAKPAAKKNGSSEQKVDAVTEAFNKGHDACIVNAFVAQTGNNDHPLVKKWRQLQERASSKDNWEESDDREYLDVCADMIAELPYRVQLKAMNWLHDQYDIDEEHRELFKEYFA